MSDSESDLRHEVIRFCQLLHQKNYLSANDGNVSVRMPGGRILVTPSGAFKAFLRSEDLVVVDERGQLISGKLKPSGEMAMHLQALKQRPEVNAVIHAHPPTAVALSLLRHQRVNGILPEVILSMGELAVVPYARPLSQELADSLTHYLDRHDAFILERHGTLAVGQTVAEAYGRTERIEHAAHVLWLAYSVGRPLPLPDHEARELTRIYERSRKPTR